MRRSKLLMDKQGITTSYRIGLCRPAFGLLHRSEYALVLDWCRDCDLDKSKAVA